MIDHVNKTYEIMNLLIYHNTNVYIDINGLNIVVMYILRILLMAI